MIGLQHVSKVKTVLYIRWGHPTPEMARHKIAYRYGRFFRLTSEQLRDTLDAFQIRGHPYTTRVVDMKLMKKKKSNGNQPIC